MCLIQMPIASTKPLSFKFRSGWPNRIRDNFVDYAVTITDFSETISLAETDFLNLPRTRSRSLGKRMSENAREENFGQGKQRFIYTIQLLQVGAVLGRVREPPILKRQRRHHHFSPCLGYHYSLRAGRRTRVGEAYHRKWWRVKLVLFSRQKSSKFVTTQSTRCSITSKCARVSGIAISGPYRQPSEPFTSIWTAH